MFSSDRPRCVVAWQQRNLVELAVRHENEVTPCSHAFFVSTPQNGCDKVARFGQNAMDFSKTHYQVVRSN